MPKKVYPELNTRVAMCEKTLLTPTQKQDLAETPSLEDAISLLSSWNFFATGDTSDYKAGLEKDKFYWLEKFGAISPGDFIKLFSLRDELHNLKIFVKEEALEQRQPSLYIGGCRYGREELSALQSKKDASPYESALVSIMEELKNDYEKNSSLVRLDLMTSLYEMKLSYEIALKTGDDDVVSAVKLRNGLDLISLVLVSKGKNIPYSDSIFDLYSKTGCGLDLKKLLESSDDENLKTLEDADYRAIYKAGTDPQGRLRFDTLADNMVIKKCRKAKYQPFGLFMVYSFLYAKMTDLKNVRVALLAKSSGSGAEEIKERLRDTYEL